MRPKITDELIAQLPEEKRKAIAEKFEKTHVLINSIEVDLLGTDLARSALLPNGKSPTLWCHLYDLSKRFNPTTNGN
ncbi:hypothetical protein ACFOW1_01550 [Parasediminibacterium paludis]|uniref:Uncharacterized protein n=1 Tax=Parasediminibacterium paludis TaxID=908966 RepID=A0ABV8PTC1_9BACT